MSDKPPVFQISSQAVQSWIQFVLLLFAIVAGIVTFDRRITTLEVKFTNHFESHQSK